MDLNKEIKLSELFKRPKKQKGPRTAKPAAKPKRAKKEELVGLKVGASQIAASRVMNDHGARLLQLARTPLAPGIVVAGEVRDVPALGQALDSFFSEHKLPRRGIRLGIGTNRVGVRALDVTGIDDERQLGNAVRFRAHEALSIPIDQAVLDFHVVGESIDDEGGISRRVVRRRGLQGADRPLHRGVPARPAAARRYRSRGVRAASCGWPLHRRPTAQVRRRSSRSRSAMIGRRSRSPTAMSASSPACSSGAGRSWSPLSGESSVSPTKKRPSSSTRCRCLTDAPDDPDPRVAQGARRDPARGPDPRSRARRLASVLPNAGGISADRRDSRHGRHEPAAGTGRRDRAPDPRARAPRRPARGCSCRERRRRSRRSGVARRCDRPRSGELMEAVNLLPEYARAGHRWTSVGSDLNARKIVQFGGGAAIVLAIVFGLLYFNERSTVSDKKSELTTAQAHLVAQQARAKPIQDAQAANSRQVGLAAVSDGDPGALGCRSRRPRACVADRRPSHDSYRRRGRSHGRDSRSRSTARRIRTIESRSCSIGLRCCPGSPASRCSRRAVPVTRSRSPSQRTTSQEQARDRSSQWTRGVVDRRGRLPPGGHPRLDRSHLAENGRRPPSSIRRSATSTHSSQRSRACSRDLSGVRAWSRPGSSTRRFRAIRRCPQILRQLTALAARAGIELDTHLAGDSPCQVRASRACRSH